MTAGPPATPMPPLRPQLRRLWAHLSRRRRIQLWMLVAMTALSAFAELLSLSAVLPFLAALAAPDRVLRYELAARMAGAMGWTEPAQLVLPLTLLFVFAMLVAGGLRVLLLWTNTRLGFAIGAELSYEVYRRTLFQPYQVHLGRNSSEVISGVVNKVGIVVYGVLLNLLTLGSALAVMLAVLAALFLAEPVIAGVTIALFGTLYLGVAETARRRLQAASREQAVHQTAIVRALQEGLGGIRDVLLDGTQEAYIRSYRAADAPMRRAQARITFISQSPRYVIEALGVVLVALLAYALSQQPGGLASSIPLLGALAIGAQRLLPALQQSYHAWASLTSCRAVLHDVLELLDQPLPPEASEPPPPPAPLRRAIELRELSFRYQPESPWVVRELSLQIPKGARVGFVGATGSGKSTVMDMLMGLLPPTAGAVLVDGEPLAGARVRAWQQTIAHVPQAIFLADASVAENIALGSPRNAIDMDRVREAARQARIGELLQGHGGMGAEVGERGVRLSGGQRQRIGIARALYKQAHVLVFDEATSALDGPTEQAIMATIEELSRDLTIVLVAHRLSTLRHCDVIFELQQGRLVAAGSFDELLASSESFRKMWVAAA